VAAGLTVGAVTAYSFLRWKPSRVEIHGNSMAPTLLPGDWALATAAGRLRIGHVVVVEHPERPGHEMVKRLTAGPGDLAPDGRPLGAGEWWVEGDDPGQSTDSRHFGPVPRTSIIERVRLVYWPTNRRRLV